MTISERLFSIMKEKNISMPELSRMTGISRHTIFDWQRRNTNPGADKIMVICEALQITPEELLIGKYNSPLNYHQASISMEDTEIELINDYKKLSDNKKKQLWAYVAMLQNMKEKIPSERNVEIITDSKGKKLVKINDIRFKGKRSINWSDVKEYLEKYVGHFFKIVSSDDVVYIGSELPDEYTGSRYTHELKGTVAKAKANATQGIPELIEIATDKHFKENTGKKHKWNARYGWYRYNSRFALPVFAEDGKVEHFNTFHASLLIRHDNNGKMYLYDIIDIKKETSNPLES